jgi:uncharacterized Tic20 family protein
VLDVQEGIVMTENPQDQPSEGGQPYSGQPSPAQPPPSGQPAPPPPPPPPPPGQAPAYGQQQAYGQAPVSASDARMWALLANIGGIFFSFIAPLIVYLIYKDRDPFVRRASSQALNFQIILIIGYTISFILFFIIIGFLTWAVLAVCGIVFPILAAIAANKGENYDYPLVPQMVT